MNNNRFNPFNQVHKGLRASLYDSALALQHNDFANPEETARVFSKLDTVLEMFEGHADIEDHHFFPAVSNRIPEVIASLEAEHETDHELGERVREGMEKYRSANDLQSRLAAGFSLSLAFYEFTAFNLSHMNREETLVNEAIWATYTDDEIRKMVAQVVSSIPPHKNELHSRWMMKGMANHEIISWLKEVNAKAPEFVYTGLLGMAADVLPASRMNTIRQALNREETAAA